MINEVSIMWFVCSGFLYYLLIGGLNLQNGEEIWLRDDDVYMSSQLKRPIVVSSPAEP